MKSSGHAFQAMALKKNQSNAHVKKSAKQRGMSGLVAGSAVNRMVTDMLKQNNFLGKPSNHKQILNTGHGAHNLATSSTNTNKILGSYIK